MKRTMVCMLAERELTVAFAADSTNGVTLVFSLMFFENAM